MWQKMAIQILANVDEECTKKRKGVLLDVEGEGVDQRCSFHVGRQLLDHVTLKRKFGTGVAIFFKK